MKYTLNLTANIWEKLDVALREGEKIRIQGASPDSKFRIEFNDGIASPGVGDKPGLILDGLQEVSMSNPYLWVMSDRTMDVDVEVCPTAASGSISLPGGATEEKQDDQITFLSSIDNKIPNLGQASAAQSTPVVLPAAQIATLTPPSELIVNAGTNLNTSALALETGGNLEIIKNGVGTDGTSPPTLPGGATGVRGWLRYLSSLLPISLGQKPAAGSLSVTVASDQATIPVNAVSLPLPTNASQEHTTATSFHAARITNGTSFIDPTQIRALTNSDVVTVNQGGSWSLNNITGIVSLPSGAATEASLAGVSSKLPATLGVKPSSNSLSVTVASDQQNINTNLNTASKGSTVAGSPTSQSFGANRQGLHISQALQDTTSTALVFTGTDSNSFILSPNTWAFFHFNFTGSDTVKLQIQESIGVWSDVYMYSGVVWDHASTITGRQTRVFQTLSLNGTYRFVRSSTNVSVVVVH